MNKEKLVGLNDFVLVEKIKEESNVIKSINSKELLSKGTVLSSECNLKDSFGLKTGRVILYISDYAIPIQKDIYAIKKEFIVATILE